MLWWNVSIAHTQFLLFLLFRAEDITVGFGKFQLLTRNSFFSYYRMTWYGAPDYEVSIAHTQFLLFLLRVVVRILWDHSSFNCSHAIPSFPTCGLTAFSVFEPGEFQLLTRNSFFSYVLVGGWWWRPLLVSIAHTQFLLFLPCR